MNRANENIINRLGQFIKKFYLNELLKGAVLTGVILGLLALLLLFTEHLFRLNSLGRGVLFFTLIFALLAVSYRYIFLPLAGLTGLKRNLNEEKAAKLIGQRIDSVGDTLLNRLQLSAMDGGLAWASIVQKERAIKNVTFDLAIDRNWLKKLMPWFGGMLLIYVLVVSLNPDVIYNSGKRIVEFDTPHHLFPPFRFEVDYPKKVQRGEDLSVSLRINGSEIPASASLWYGNKKWIMLPANVGFEYKLEKVAESGSFTLKSGKYDLGTFAFEVEKKPEFREGYVALNYPNYLDRDNEEQGITKRLRIPEGTVLKFKPLLRDVNETTIRFADTSLVAVSGEWTDGLQIRQPKTYDFISDSDTLLRAYGIEVIKDDYPRLRVNREVDSIYNSLVFLSGEALDDHGVRNINVVIEEEGKRVKTIPVRMTKGAAVPFATTLDLSEYEKQEGTNLTYYIEAFDNDAVNGYKRVKSGAFSVRLRSVSESKEERKRVEEEVVRDLSEAKKELEKAKEAIEKYERDKATGKKDAYSDKQEVQRIQEQLKSINKQLDETIRKKENERINRTEPSDADEEIAEKQRQLDELIEKTLDEETKKLLEELSELMEKLNEEGDAEQEDLEMSAEDVLENLDKNLEMFKRLSVELGIEEQLNEWEKLAEEQQALADSAMSDEERKTKQDSVNKELDRLNEEVEDLKKKNGELESPLDMDWGDQERSDAEKNTGEAKDRMEKGDMQKGKQSGKSAEGNMREAQKKMANSLSKSREQQQSENMENLRQIQDNLLKLSFNQEEVLEAQLRTATSDPNFRSLTVKQKSITDDFVVIEDSLKALYKRVLQLEQTIKPEVDNINHALPRATESMEGLKQSDASQRQREAMTSMNNLALLLSEVIQQMQQQMAQSKFGEGACSKPGQGAKPSMSQMKSQQEALKKEMERLKKQMEQGESGDKGEKGKKKGEKPGAGNGGMSKEMARMAARQQAIREAMRKMAEDATKSGSGASGELKEIQKEMEKIEEDLLYKNLSLETIKRQEEILTRMLKAEEAMREQEEDNKREAQDGSGIDQVASERLKEYLKKREREVELLKEESIKLTPYYEQKTGMYLNGSGKP